MKGQLRILIVEDQPTAQVLLEKMVQPLLKHWPDSQIIFATKFEAALDLIRETPAPDIVLLDLTLDDQGYEETLKRIDEIESHSPLVIVTGHAEERVRELLDHRPFEIVAKGGDGMGARLIAAILKAFAGWHGRHFEQAQANIERMREIVAAGGEHG